jgi:hypothetical protein
LRLHVAWRADRLREAPVLSGTKGSASGFHRLNQPNLERGMNGLIYLIGLIVVIMAILSFLGLR